MALPVDVVRSVKRRKTVQATEVDGRLRVMIPSWMSAEDEAHWVAEMQRRIGGRPATLDSAALARRASALAARYRLPAPATIAWTNRQQRRWGSCTPATATIRISARLAKAPAWVLDFVIVHELAHLVVAAHDARFGALVARYPRAERAQGFLDGWGALPDEVDDASPIIGLDHVSVPVPPDRDADVTAFYAGLLGLPPTDGPGEGLWFGHDGLRLVAEPTGDWPRRNVALGVRGLPDLISRLADAGHTVCHEGPDAASVVDPFGNRIDLVDRTGVLTRGDDAPADLRQPRRHRGGQDESAAALD